MTETTPTKDVPSVYTSKNVKKECCFSLLKSAMTEPKYYECIIEELKSNFGYLYKSKTIMTDSFMTKLYPCTCVKTNEIHVEDPPVWWNQKLVAVLRYMGYKAKLKSSTSIGHMNHNTEIFNIVSTTYILEVSCI